MPQKRLPPYHERPVVAIIPAILVPFSPSPLIFQGYRASPSSRHDWHFETQRAVRPTHIVQIREIAGCVVESSTSNLGGRGRRPGQRPPRASRPGLDGGLG